MSDLHSSRRGLNISQFLKDMQVGVLEPSSDIYDTDMYTNSEFFDAETGQNADFQPQPAKSTEASHSTDAMENFSASLDFDYAFPDFGDSYASPTIPSFPDSLNNLQPIQPSPTSAYPAPPQQNGYAPTQISGNAVAESRSPKRPPGFEEQARHAADEDKRRRNTAASARFRVKKKQREQALERSQKDMAELVTSLKRRVSELETQNKWLKSMVLEKNGGNEEILLKLMQEFKSKEQAELKKEAELASTRVPTSPEERDAVDSSG